MTMLSAKHALCSHIFKDFVLYFSLKIRLKSSHLYSSDTNYKVVQQALTLPNKAKAACHRQLWDIMPPQDYSVCQENCAAVNKKGKNDVDHAERPFGCPNQNWI